MEVHNWQSILEQKSKHDSTKTKDDMIIFDFNSESLTNDPLLSPILSETLVSAPVEGVKNEVGAFLGPLHG